MLHRGINSWRKWYNCTCDSIREAGLSYFRLVKRWIGINVTIKLCKTKNVALFFRKISIATTILPLVLFLGVPWDRTLYCCCYKIAKELSSLQKSFFRSSVGVNGVQDGFTFTFTLLILAATNQLPIAAISKIQKYSPGWICTSTNQLSPLKPYYERSTNTKTRTSGEYIAKMRNCPFSGIPGRFWFALSYPSPPWGLVWSERPWIPKSQ